MASAQSISGICLYCLVIFASSVSSQMQFGGNSQSYPGTYGAVQQQQQPQYAQLPAYQYQPYNSVPQSPVQLPAYSAQQPVAVNQNQMYANPQQFQGPAPQQQQSLYSPLSNSQPAYYPGQQYSQAAGQPLYQQNVLPGNMQDVMSTGNGNGLYNPMGRSMGVGQQAPSFAGGQPINSQAVSPQASNGFGTYQPQAPMQQQQTSAGFSSGQPTPMQQSFGGQQNTFNPNGFSSQQSGNFQRPQPQLFPQQGAPAVMTANREPDLRAQLPNQNASLPPVSPVAAPNQG